MVPAERRTCSCANDDAADDNAAASPAAAKRRMHDTQPVCGLRHGGLRERRLAIRAGDDAASNATAHATSNTGPDRRLLDARSVRRHSGSARRLRERRVVSGRRQTLSLRGGRVLVGESQTRPRVSFKPAPARPHLVDCHAPLKSR